MKFLQNLLNRSRLAKFKLKYDEKEAQWMVLKSNRMIYVGNQSQCQQFVEYNHDAFL